MATYAKLGNCLNLLIPLDCDGNIDTAADQVASCSTISVEENPILTEGTSLTDPSGTPNRNCVTVEIDPEFDAFELVINTCSLFDTRLDATFGYSEEMTTANGVRALKKQGPDCVCSCGKETCKKCFALITWSLAYCAGINKCHPDGKFVMTVYPKVCPRPNTATRTTNAELNGREYLARVEENPNFGQGIQIDGQFVIPADEAPFDRCKYEYITDICPPNACECGTCDESNAGGLRLPAGAGRIAVARPSVPASINVG